MTNDTLDTTKGADTMDQQHRDGCPGKMRYGATIRSTKAAKANGTAGKVLMICRDTSCPGRRYL